MNYLRFAFLLFSVSIFLGCSKEDGLLDKEILGLGGDSWVKGPLDHWLDENFVTPYNIEVKYRFDRYELALNRVLVPPREDQVQKIMEIVKKVWILPYEQEVGSTFIKKLSPKQFVLVGSPLYNPDGTITLGTAEGGRKVVLLEVNNISKEREFELRRMLRTIHHEFAHILHQEVMFPEEYRRITTDYTASWQDYPLEIALSKGYISSYARASPEEDFVEMVSWMLVYGEKGYNEIVKSAPASAQPLLKAKEEIVVRYFKQTWNIDLYSLQSKTEAAINAL